MQFRRPCLVLSKMAHKLEVSLFVIVLKVIASHVFRKTAVFVGNGTRSQLCRRRAHLF